MWVSFSLSRRFFSANSPSRLRMNRLWWEQAEGHTLKTRLMCRNITVIVLSASTLTFSTAPGAQANTSAKVCPGPVLERMLRFPQISSCIMRALPANTRPTSSTCSPARSRRGAFWKGVDPCPEAGEHGGKLVVGNTGEKRRGVERREKILSQKVLFR